MRGESGGVYLKFVQFFMLNNVIFKFLQVNDNEVEDDDGNDCIFFKEWQLIEMISFRFFVNINGNGMFYSVWLLVKENKVFFGGFLLLKDNNYNCFIFFLEINGDVCILYFIYRVVLFKFILFEFKRIFLRDQFEDGVDNRMFVEGFEDYFKIKFVIEFINYVLVFKLIGFWLEKNYCYYSIRFENGIFLL